MPSFLPSETGADVCVFRMFETFEAERDSGIVYGLVDQPQFWNPVKHQVNYKIVFDNVLGSEYFSCFTMQKLLRKPGQ